MDNEFENQKLLIVDDDRVWLNQLSRAMSRRGLIVFEAQSVKDGLDILKKEKFDYGVIDLRLDDGDGLEILKQLYEKRINFYETVSKKKISMDNLNTEEVLKKIINFLDE